MEKEKILGIVVLLSTLAFGMIAGCLDSGTVESGAVVLNLDMDISGDANTVKITVLSGSGDWFDYQILVDGTTELTTTSTSFSAGMESTFSDPLATWDPVPGTSYVIKVIEIGENRVVYMDTIIAKA
jgi:hypothetical protein